MLPSRSMDRSIFMFTLIPASIMPVLVMDSCSWLAMRGCLTYLARSSICMGFWLLTPKWRTLPLLCS
ncbi:hypothetical protein D3C80_2017210 [compost metagenome]